MTRARAVTLSLVAVAVLIQLVPIRRDNPQASVSARVTAPPDVASILRPSCDDCHSNDTIWPWYSHVAPVSWLVARDVHECRRHLNFSEWNSYSGADRQEKLHHIPEHVESGEMPLWYYLPLHPAARMSADDVTRVSNWAESQKF